MNNISRITKVFCSLLAATFILGPGIQACRSKAKESPAAEATAESMEEGTVLEGTIAVSGAWALYPMVVKWAEEFQKIHPKVQMDIAAGGAGKGMADALAGIVDIGMVSRTVYPAEIEKGAWWISVAKDAVVPTVNNSNPLLQEILARGIKKEALTGIWVTGTVKSWGEAIGLTGSQAFGVQAFGVQAFDVQAFDVQVSGGQVSGDQASGGQVAAADTWYPIHVYTRSDACGAAETWAQFLEHHQEDLLGIGVYGDPGLTEAVSTDSLAIGFNNINYVYQAGNKNQIKGVRVIPLDLNGNGALDGDENFYSDRDAITRGIATGKYPSPPARDLHFVSQGRPQKKAVTAFMTWVLTEGQKYVPESGYVNLTEQKLQEELNKLKGE